MCVDVVCSGHYLALCTRVSVFLIMVLKNIFVVLPGLAQLFNRGSNGREFQQFLKQ